MTKELHPSWFKMRIERRELLQEVQAEKGLNAILACLDFLETGEKPQGLDGTEKLVFAAFVPDLEETWRLYMQRVENSKNGGAPKGNKNARKR